MVVARLINARQHLLALRIAALLGMGPEKARTLWPPSSAHPTTGLLDHAFN